MSTRSATEIRSELRQVQQAIATINAEIKELSQPLALPTFACPPASGELVERDRHHRR